MSPFTQRSLRECRAAIHEIGRRFGVSEIRVYGSVARGTAREGSDIDLLVRMDEGRSLLDLIGFEQATVDLLGTRVDVVAEDGLNPALRAAILTEARPL